MKKNVCRCLLLLLGFLPLAFGWLVHYGMMDDESFYRYLRLPGFALLVVWFLFSYLGRKFLKSTKQTMFFLNAAAFLVLLLIGIQEMIFRAYWFNSIGLNTQYFYLSLLNISFSLTPWAHTTFAAYCAAFLLLILASFLGCKLHQRRTDRLLDS